MRIDCSLIIDARLSALYVEVHGFLAIYSIHQCFNQL